MTSPLCTTNPAFLVFLTKFLGLRNSPPLRGGVAATSRRYREASFEERTGEAVKKIAAMFKHAIPFLALGCALSRLRSAALGCALSRLRSAAVVQGGEWCS